MPVGRLVAKLAIPCVLAQAVNILYNIVDRVYLGHLEDTGDLALTGVGLCMPVIILIMAFAVLAGSGGAPLASIAMGKGDTERAGRILGNSLSMLIILAVILTAVFLIIAEPMLMLFGASENTIDYALDYTRIYVCGSIFVMLTLGLTPFMNAQGFSKAAMLTTVTGAVINIVLDPILIFALDMEVMGAALATIFSQAVSAVIVIVFLTKGKKTILRINLQNMRLDPKVFGPVLGLGVSAFIMISTESILSLTFNASLSAYGGDVAVAAMTIILSCGQLVLMPLQGLTQGCQPIISFNFGAGNPERVKKCFRILLSLAAGYALLFCAVCVIFPKPVVSIFSNDAQLVEFTAWALRIYMAGMFAFGFQIACQHTFLALGQSKISLLLACLRKLILLIPLILVLPLFFENRVFAVFLAEPVSDIIAGAATTAMFFWRFNKILEKGADGINR